MSNEFKEWLRDRKEEAYIDIHTIAEIAEENNAANTEECFYRIVKILQAGGWLD